MLRRGGDGVLIRRRLGAVLVAVLVLLVSCAESPRPSVAPTRLSIDPARSLLINDVTVVTDPARTVHPCVGASSLPVWSFGYLMKQMVAQRQGLAPDEFIRRWLGLLGSDQQINDQLVPKRDIRRLLGPWEKTGWDLTKVPFRLLAIVNRIDLRRSPLLAGENAGEVRFIFGAVDVEQHCNPMQFTVIVEFGVRQNSCSSLQDWARRWADLSTLGITTPQYRQALEDLTRPVVESDPTIAKPNGSRLDQIRTNEIALGSQWEMREFRISPRTGLLRQEPVTMTPSDRWNNTRELAELLDALTGGLRLRDYWIALRFPSGAPLLAGASRVPDEGLFWRAPGYGNAQARHTFSLNTCSGCHARETNTKFTHVDPSTGDLSRFLNGKNADGSGFTVPDPVDSTIPPRPFSELANRAAALEQLVQDGCWALPPAQSLRFVH